MIKRVIIAQVGSAETIRFACHELGRYLNQLDSSVMIEGREYDAYMGKIESCIWVGTGISIPKAEQDRMHICIENGSGYITGSNDRSVLFSVYRFLFELGCRFLYPGKDGDVIPKKSIEFGSLNVCIDEIESYHHRAVCIEGAVSYEHVKNMLEWIPKVYMNGYYYQFKTPFTFFERWYSHVKNPKMAKEPLSLDDVSHIYKRLVAETKKRGLLYHAVGHGWTCEPLGITGASWAKYEDELPQDMRKLLALTNGKRELWNKVGINTNLCYSNKAARDLITDDIVKYCVENPQADYVHFWLADDSNNQCECDECKKMRPSDWYVMMLNELDCKLSAIGVGTKIVFLVYVDLLWKPETERIKNTDRFTLMFAPITRSYSKAFADFESTTTLPPYERNMLKMPRDVSENVAHLKSWQEQFCGDSFDFDYHLMWDYVKDLGLQKNAWVLHEDMKNLDKIGLNGMVSCQVQRCAFPVNISMYAMTKALWNKNSKFEDVTHEYYSAQFGENAEAVFRYLSELSRIASPEYMRREREITADILQAIPHIERFEKEYIAGNEDKREWRYLGYHAKMCRMLVLALYQKAVLCDDAAMIKTVALLDEFVQSIEEDANSVFDLWNYTYVVHAFLKLPINPNE